MDYVTAFLDSDRWTWVLEHAGALTVILFAVAALGATATWLILEARYRRTIFEQRRRLKEYARKFHGATPDEILRRIESLQTRLDRLEPRRLSSRQKKILEKNLPLPEGAGRTKINVVFDARCVDGQQYAADFVRALKACRGWRPSTETLFGWARELPSGIAIVCYRHGRTVAAARALSKALAEAGIDHETIVSPEEELELVITSRHLVLEEFESE